MLDEIYEAGRNFKWETPTCEKCNLKMWVHSFTTRYFDGYANQFWIKKFRCKSCGTVFTPKMKDFLPRYQTSTPSIIETILYRLTNLGWPNKHLRQRCGHWLRKFLTKLKMDCPGSSPIDVLSIWSDKQIPFLL
jgi:hypothetical protein